MATNEDFTIEAWIFIPTGTGAVWVMGMDGKNYWILENPVTFNGDIDPERSVGASIPNDEWFHVALCRSAGDLRFFINGTQQGSTFSDGEKTYFTQQANLLIGQQEGWGPSGPFYMDDFRILKGFAIYAANFTPPTSELEVYP
jgi:hypothetical protein